MTEQAEDALDVALRVAAALEAVGAAYFIGGSLASSLQGEPRATNDIDIVVDMRLGRVHDFRTALGNEFEVDEQMLREALLHGTCANLFYMPLVMKIDIFGCAHGPFDESELARRRRVKVRDDGAELWVKAPEDTILRKLLWYVDGGQVSDRQWRDIIGVMRNSAAELDQAYLDAWSARLGVNELLTRARQAAGPQE